MLRWGDQSARQQGMAGRSKRMAELPMRVVELQMRMDLDGPPSLL